MPTHNLSRIVSALALLAVTNCDLLSGGNNPRADGGGADASADAPRTGGMPSRADIDAARARVDAVVGAGSRARTLLQMLGLLPDYTCGEPRRTYLSRVPQGVTARLACATVTTRADGETADVVTIAFPDAGCSFGGHALTGSVSARVSGGESRLDVAADFRALRLDGAGVDAQGGIARCGDEDRAWVRAEGPTAAGTGAPMVSRYRIDAGITRRAGGALFGSTTLILDGTGELSGMHGTDSVTVRALTYEMGARLPRSGSVTVRTAAGRSYAVTFHNETPVVGTVEVVIDNHDPVSIPVVH